MRRTEHREESSIPGCSDDVQPSQPLHHLLLSLHCAVKLTGSSGQGLTEQSVGVGGRVVGGSSVSGWLGELVDGRVDIWMSG